MASTIQERLAEFYRRLHAAPAASSATEALSLLTQTLEQVEDELSGIQKATVPPAPSEHDGRMYPPQEDRMVRMPDGGLVAWTRGHIVRLSCD